MTHAPLDDDPIEPTFVCATCGLPLDGDPDDDPTGDAGQPICGECDRARNFDADLEADWLSE